MPNVNTILVIDDDPIASLIMERANHMVQLAEQVHCFYSAVDGLNYLNDLKARRQKFPEIIFLDICMPIVSGWQFLEQLEALGGTDTSVYMLALSADQEHMNRAMNVASVKDYIVKPITVERLKAIKSQRVDQTSGVPAIT